MNTPTLRTIHHQYRETQSLVLHVADGLRPEQWSSHSIAMGAPIAFHVWHIAREADVLASLIRQSMQEPAGQIWDRERLATRWGFRPESLGLLQSGIGMHESEASVMPWPDGDAILTYLRLAFDDVNEAIARLDDRDPNLTPGLPAAAMFAGARTVDCALMRAIANGNRHLGIIGWLSTSMSAERSQRISLVPAISPVTDAEPAVSPGNDR